MATAAVVVILGMADMAIKGLEMLPVIGIGFRCVIMAISATGRKRGSKAVFVNLTVTMNLLLRVAVKTGVTGLHEVDIRLRPHTKAEIGVSTATAVAGNAIIPHIRRPRELVPPV